MSIPFQSDDPFEYGQIQTVTPMIRRLVARNPGAFTFHGTGTFIIGHGQVAVIDPGPDLTEHVDALLAALAGETITHLLVTHTHRDHSPACRALQAASGAPTYGFGRHGSGRYEQGVQVEEGGDMEFVPDRQVRHGDIIEGQGWRFECVYTPGHTSNHVCYRWPGERTLFSGDHVMAWSTSIISPPDGDMRRYLASLELLLEGDDLVYRPTHGPCVRDPKPFVQAYIDHRNKRLEQILECLGDGLRSIADMVPLMYRELPTAMYPAAARSVLASLIYLYEDERVGCAQEPGIDAEFFTL